MESSSSEVKKFCYKTSPLKITIFWANLCKTGVPAHGPHPKQKTIIFFSEIIKPDPKLSKPFYFNKIPYVLAELCFSILCNAFLLKSAISSHNSCGSSIKMVQKLAFTLFSTRTAQGCLMFELYRSISYKRRLFARY